MRISDWSSDVCSSDLASVGGIGAAIMVRDRRPVAADWSPFGSGPLQRLFQIIEAIDRVRIRFFALVAPDAAFPAEEGHVAQRDHGRGRMKRQKLRGYFRESRFRRCLGDRKSTRLNSSH